MKKLTAFLTSMMMMVCMVSASVQAAHTFEDDRTDEYCKQLLETCSDCYVLNADGVYTYTSCVYHTGENMFEPYMPNPGTYDRSDLLLSLVRIHPENKYLVKIKMNGELKGEAERLAENGIDVKPVNDYTCYAIMTAEQLENFPVSEKVGYLLSLSAPLEEVLTTEPRTTEYWEKYTLVVYQKPNKLTYHIGEQLDLTGGLAAASYRNSEGVDGDISFGDPLTADIFTIKTDFDSSQPGIYTVYVSAADGKAQDCFTVEVVQDETIPVSVPVAAKGDLNGDGVSDIMDVIRLNKALLGVEQLTDEQRAAADVNNNGTVDSGDSLLILKYALEMINGFDAMQSDVQLDAAVRFDLTRDVDTATWEKACSPSTENTKVVTSAEELADFSADLRPAVQRELANRYDAAFFDEHVLILHLGVNGYMDHQEFSGIAYKDDALTVTTKQKDTDDYTTYVQLWQIALPKAQYNGKGAVWTEEDTEYCYDADYTFQLPGWAMPGQIQPIKKLEQGVLVTSAEEELALLNEAYGTNDATAEDYGLSEDIYKDNVRFYKTSSMIHGIRNTMWQLRKTGNQLIADIYFNDDFGDTVGIGLECVTIPARLVDADTQISFRKVKISNAVTTSGKLTTLTAPSPALAICQYQFGDSYETAFYWYYSGGSDPHFEYRFITSEAVSADVSDFSKCEVPYGKSCRNDEEGFNVERGTDGVTVTFMKSKSTGETTTLSFPFPQNQQK